MKKKFKIGSNYVIKWLDHSGFAYNRWRGSEEASELKPMEVYLIGKVIYQTDTWVTTVSTWDNETVPGYRDVNVTLKDCIIGVQELKLRNGKDKKV